MILSRPHHLPEFAFHHTELHLDTPIHRQERYESIHPTAHHNPKLGTRIWTAHIPSQSPRCVKEFYLADPQQYTRHIPDPIWRNFPPNPSPQAHERGLYHQRAQSYNAKTSVPLDTNVLQSIGQDPLFREHFNAYSFELEALLLQFAQHYGYQQLVQSYHWGSILMEDNTGPRFTIEMELLQELPLPAPGDWLSISHRLLDMMSAVTQLHAMMIPVRCYPPELVRDLHQARENPITRSFHYDLSPDQFMLRPANHLQPEQIVLIDFNSSRMNHAECNNFFWYAIPGKEYYHPPERRNLREYRQYQQTFQSSPIYDLYALLVMALFCFFRKREEQIRPEHIEGWDKPEAFRSWLQSPRFATDLHTHFSSRRIIDPSILVALWRALLPHPPLERRHALQSISALGWPGLHDWMLVPKVMDTIARQTLQRKFSASWTQSSLELTEDSSPLALRDLLNPRLCSWQPGPSERGRIDHPDLQLDQLTFIQAGDNYPIVRHGILEPCQAGQYQIFPVWRGCVDFHHPLHISILPSTSASVSRSHLVPHTTTSELSGPPNPQHMSIEPPGLPEHTLIQPSVAPFSMHESPKNDFFSPPHLSHPSEGSVLPHPSDHSPTPQDLPIDAFWSQPPTPLHSFAPSVPSATKDFSRERHVSSVPEAIRYARPDQQDLSSSSHRLSPQHTSPHDTLQTIPALPSGTLASPGVEILAIPKDPIPWPVQLDHQYNPPPPSWLAAISQCQDIAQLNDIDESMRAAFSHDIPLDHQVQLYTRYCELLLQQRCATLDSPILEQMEILIHRHDISKLHLGILINNLTVYCYQIAWQQQRLPDWESFRRENPLPLLKHWLQLSESPLPQTSDHSMKNLRSRCRETLRCAVFIQQAVDRKSR